MDLRCVDIDANNHEQDKISLDILAHLCRRLGTCQARGRAVGKSVEWRQQDLETGDAPNSSRLL